MTHGSRVFGSMVSCESLKVLPCAAPMVRKEQS